MKRCGLFGRATILLLLTTAPALADIIGSARVIDGDTMAIGKIRIRLYGIDAPEAKQSCLRPGNAIYLCGAEATKILRSVTRDQEVRCKPKDQDRYGRVVAICWAGPIDLNRMMVAQGWAVAYRHYSERYVQEEDAARRGRLGIWSGKFELPAEWRRQHPR